MEEKEEIVEDNKDDEKLIYNKDEDHNKIKNEEEDDKLLIKEENKEDNIINNDIKNNDIIIKEENNEQKNDNNNNNNLKTQNSKEMITDYLIKIQYTKLFRFPYFIFCNMINIYFPCYKFESETIYLTQMPTPPFCIVKNDCKHNLNINYIFIFNRFKNSYYFYHKSDSFNCHAINSIFIFNFIFLYEFFCSNNFNYSHWDFVSIISYESRYYIF